MLKKSIGGTSLILGLLLLVSLNFTKTSAQNTQNFDIHSFNADYYLSQEQDKSSTLKVREIIVAEFPKDDQNHGILRAIPKNYQNHTVSLKIQSVTDTNNQPYQYTTYSENNNEILKIGDPNTFVHGKTTYVINYTLRNVISFQPEQDEFYWDINGDQWPQSFGVVEVKLHIPNSLKGVLHENQECYSGSYGSSLQNCTINRINGVDEIIVHSKAENVLPYSTLTIAVAFNDNTFVNGSEVQREQLIQTIMALIWVFFIVILPILVLIYMFRRWYKFGRDPRGKGVIVPEYQPPKNMDVASSDYLLQEKFRVTAISASIIGMATRKHLTIYEIPKKGIFGSRDYEIEFHQKENELNDTEKSIIEMLMAENTSSTKRIKLSELKYKLATQVKNFDKKITDTLTEQQYFTKNPAKVKSNYATWGIILMVVGFFTTALMGLGIGLIISGLIVLIFASKMPAKTAKGVEVRDYLKGLEMYMKLAEADRIKYLQSPEGAEKFNDDKNFNPKNKTSKIKLFESLLPYAILFGLEKEWAKQFEGLYQQPPGWYSGNLATFNTAYLASSLSDFNNAAMPAFSSPSSSGSSGFGGGGFSGGGGGGGGGGGW